MRKFWPLVIGFGVVLFAFLLPSQVFPPPGGGGGGSVTAYSRDLNIDAPSTVDTNKYQLTFPAAVTINRVHCSTDTGTVSINLDVRAIATPNVAGTDVLSAVLVCDNNTQSACASGCDVNTITAGSAGAHLPVNLQVSATASAPNVVRIHVEAQ